MQISLDSADTAVAQKVLGITDRSSVQKVMQVIRNFKKNDIEVRVKAVLTSYNADS